MADIAQPGTAWALSNLAHGSPTAIEQDGSRWTVVGLGGRAVDESFGRAYLRALRRMRHQI
jgi:hypothetical protein